MDLLSLSFRGMNLSQLAVWFFIYSFCGWAMECVVIRVQLGRWENRGFAKLPFCVIYGFGTFIAFNIFAPIENNYLLLYILGCICATAFEYITALLMLRLFGEVWWNYEHLPFNYKGILCLESTLAWGLLAIFIFGFFNKVVQGFVMSLDGRVVTVAAIVLTVSYLFDFVLHFSKGVYAKNAQRRIDANGLNDVTEVNENISI